MSIILVVTSFVGDKAGGADGTTRVVVGFFFNSTAMLAADQSSIIEAIAARQAAGFIAEPVISCEGSGRQIMNPSRASGEMDWSYCRDVFMIYKFCARNCLLFLTTT